MLSYCIFNHFDIIHLGQLQGLNVILDSEGLRHVPAPRQNTGFKVLLHPRDDIANLLDFGMDLDIGKRTSVRIEPIEVIHTANFISYQSKLGKSTFAQNGILLSLLNSKKCCQDKEHILNSESIMCWFRKNKRTTEWFKINLTLKSHFSQAGQYTKFIFRYLQTVIS